VGRLATATAVLVAVFLGASAIGARVVVAGSRAPFTVAASQIGPSYVDVTFPSRDDHLALSGWLFRAERPSGRSVVLVHGWQGNREDVDFVPLSRQLLVRGYDVLMFDLRGSGLSAGSYETLAHDEPRDLLGAYDFMRSRGYAPGLMTVLGNSMGAATVLEAAPELRDVAALVSDSAFAELSSTLEGGLTRFTRLPGVLALPAMQLARMYGVLPTLSPVDVVRSLPDRAFLFIHARGDRLIPVSNAVELDAASANTGSRLLVLDGTDHLDTYTHDPARYLDAVLRFIDEQVARDAAAGAR
jgi:pimeloyl-ACP methyl ester carboxylesterase